MRLYPYPDPVPVVDAPEGHFEPADDGGFDFPDPLFTRLHSTHHGKKKRWETEVERDERRHGEDRDRRRDPETLYNAVAEIAAAARGHAQGVPADVLAELAAMRAELAELRAERAAAQDDSTSENDSEDSGTPAEGKPPSRRDRGAKSGPE